MCFVFDRLEKKISLLMLIIRELADAKSYLIIWSLVCMCVWVYSFLSWQQNDMHKWLYGLQSHIYAQNDSELVRESYHIKLYSTSDEHWVDRCQLNDHSKCNKERRKTLHKEKKKLWQNEHWTRGEKNHLSVGEEEAAVPDKFILTSIQIKCISHPTSCSSRRCFTEWRLFKMTKHTFVPDWNWEIQVCSRTYCIPSSPQFIYK